MAGRYFVRAVELGLIVWRQAVYDQLSYAQLAEAFEEIGGQDDPFAEYPIIRIWPKR